MRPGLAGRRVAALTADDAQDIVRALEGAGAEVRLLSQGGQEQPDSAWHGGDYTALVIGPTTGAEDPRTLQLIREFLVSEKPIVVFGRGFEALQAAGGSREDATVVAEDADRAQFAQRLVSALEKCLVDREVDEMSAQSFPASDPPSTTPASIGHLRSDESDARS